VAAWWQPGGDKDVAVEEAEAALERARADVRRARDEGRGPSI
jgi:hypothetical protein